MGNRVHTTLYEISEKQINACFPQKIVARSTTSKKLERPHKKTCGTNQVLRVRRFVQSKKKGLRSFIFVRYATRQTHPKNLHARGSFHATKRSVNAKHNNEVTEIGSRWP